ncbi:hypothetical protein [Streptomyces sp. MJP52]|uniref:hypothetical protein n=1 Tax=Streptomyces sp. MJP52 TaxID=2940555 RepID=UPI002472F377|nr:hypothetical protein [Streptomyces sp. MJP52]MDH6226219.1 hypothetical protein [Streptomyces sp. MJP52]
MEDVAEETAAEIEQLGVSGIAPGLAALAKSLARAVDAAGGNVAAHANAARELRAVMKDLRGLAPVRAEGGALDDLAARRAKRRGA